MPLHSSNLQQNVLACLGMALRGDAAGSGDLANIVHLFDSSKITASGGVHAREDY